MHGIERLAMDKLRYVFDFQSSAMYLFLLLTHMIIYQTALNAFHRGHGGRYDVA